MLVARAQARLVVWVLVARAALALKVRKTVAMQQVTGLVVVVLAHKTGLVQVAQ
jgi:hypothetical protein